MTARELFISRIAPLDDAHLVDLYKVMVVALSVSQGTPDHHAAGVSVGIIESQLIARNISVDGILDSIA